MSVRIRAALVVALALTASPSAAQQVAPEYWGTDGQVNTVVVHGDAVYVGGAFNAVYPITGGGVSLSPGSGELWPDFPKVDGYVYAVVGDGAGGWFIGGTFAHVGGVPRDNLAHVLADGSVSAWDPGIRDSYGMQDGARVRSLALDRGTLYVGGMFTMVGRAGRRQLAAVDARTGELSEWAPDPNGMVHSFLVRGDSLYAAGRFNRIAGSVRSCLAAFDLSTGRLTAWDPAPDNWVEGLARAGDVLYAAGRFTQMAGSSRGRLAAFEMATGALLPWDPGADGDVLAMVPTPHGIFVGGAFDSVGGEARQRLAAVDPASGIPTAWATGAAFVDVCALALADGVLGVGGTGAIAALDPTTGAQRWRRYVDGTAYALGIACAPAPTRQAPHDRAPDRREGEGHVICAGGAFRSAAERLPRANAAAFDLRSGAATPWAPAVGGTVSALAASGDRIWLGGDFATVNGDARRGLAAVDPANGTTKPATPGVDGNVQAMAARGDRLYVGGWFAQLGDSSRCNIGALDTRTSAVAAWNPGASADVCALAVAGRAVYAGGLFYRAGGGGSGLIARGRGAAFDAGNGELLPWDPQADEWIWTVLPDDERVYVGGAFHHLHGQPRYALGATDPESGAPADWAPPLTNYDDYPLVRAVAVHGDGVWVGGRFQMLGGEWRYHLGAVDAGTGAATPWDPDLLGTPRALAVRGNMLYVGGAFTEAGGYPVGCFCAIRLPADGPHRRPGRARAAQERPAASLALTCAPNPVRTCARLRFALPEGGPVTLGVYDLAGRCVASVLDGTCLPAGRHDLDLRTGGWPPGVYLVRLGRGERFETRRIAVVP